MPIPLKKLEFELTIDTKDFLEYLESRMLPIPERKWWDEYVIRSTAYINKESGKFRISPSFENWLGFKKYSNNYLKGSVNGHKRS